MKKNYILFLFLVSVGIGFAQITEISNFDGSSQSDFGEFFVANNGDLYFKANDGTNGAEPYIYNGSTITLLKDINTTAFASGNSNPGLFIEFNGLIYFKASDGDEDVGNNETELWQTDGTEMGTVLVADINPTASGNPQDFFILSNELYFEVNDGSSTQIWRLNSGSPIKVTNNNGGGFASPSAPLVFAGGAYVRMNSGNGNNPHFFNGTTATELVDATTSTERGRGLFNNEVYFEGDDGSGVGDELWKTDGTIAGTSLVADILIGTGNSDPRDFVEFNGELYFAAEDSDGYNLWKTDGTTAGTVEVVNTNLTGNSDVGGLFSDGTDLYFTASDGANGIELWKFDGTTLGMLSDINPTGDSNASDFVALGGVVFFIANDGSGDKLWFTDGTAVGTQSVAANVGSGDDPTGVDNLTVSGTNLIFSGDGTNGIELFSFNPATLSVDHNELDNVFAVYPNPSRDKITVTGNFTSSVDYSILDINGRTILKGELTNNTIEHQLKSGLYILQLNTLDSSITRKIMVK